MSGRIARDAILPDRRPSSGTSFHEGPPDKDFTARLHAHGGKRMAGRLTYVVRVGKGRCGVDFRTLNIESGRLRQLPVVSSG